MKQLFSELCFPPGKVGFHRILGNGKMIGDLCDLLPLKIFHPEDSGHLGRKQVNGIHDLLQGRFVGPMVRILAVEYGFQVQEFMRITDIQVPQVVQAPVPGGLVEVGFYGGPVFDLISFFPEVDKKCLDDILGCTTVKSISVSKS